MANKFACKGSKKNANVQIFWLKVESLTVISKKECIPSEYTPNFKIASNPIKAALIRSLWILRLYI